MAKGRAPKCRSFIIPTGTSYDTNTWAIATLYGRPAKFCQLTNKSSSDVSVQLNNDEDARFVLEGTTTQTFNWGDMLLDTVEFQNLLSGGTDAIVEVIVGI